MNNTISATIISIIIALIIIGIPIYIICKKISNKRKKQKILDYQYKKIKEEEKNKERD